MKITILTIFPEMFAPLHLSMLGRAEKAGLLDIREVDIRSYSKNKHHNTDDAPYGGGAGMVMLAQPIVDAMRDVQGEHFAGRRIYLSPRGKTLTQQKVEELATEKELILLCGHYEGVDQRALDLCIDEEISIGDYILTGGELGAMVLVDSVARLVPGVLGCEESAQTESFSSGLLEHPQYTRPREFEGMTVPEPLLNGNHAHIQDWQLSESLYITLRRRPEMAQKFLAGRKFTRHQKKVVDAVLERIRQEDEAAENARSEEGDGGTGACRAQWAKQAGGASEIARSAACGTTMRVSRTEIPQRSPIAKRSEEKPSGSEALPDGEFLKVQLDLKTT